VFRPLINILVSDIEDSSSLFEKLGDLRAQVVFVRVHNEIFDSKSRPIDDMKLRYSAIGFMIRSWSRQRCTAGDLRFVPMDETQLKGFVGTHQYSKVV
jgi:hypothetical protein